MKILITGGSGFIGRNLFEGLKDKYVVFAPTHQELDVADYLALEKFINKQKIEIIIHAAVKGGNNVFENTLRMFVSIIRNAEKLDKIIHFGSGAEYDKTRDLIKIKESAWGNRIPADSYGLAKFICSEIAKNNKKIKTLRLFGVYGKYEDYRFKFISNTIAKVLLGLPIVIKQDVIFDYLYIDDLLKIIDYFLAHSSRYSEYNIVPPLPIKISTIAGIVANITSRNPKIIIKNQGMNLQYTANNSQLLKFYPSLQFTPYSEGINRLYEYYRKNIKLIDKNALIQDEYYSKAKIKSI